MHKFQAHAATDVTGFGLLGHANNLAAQQRNEVAFVIHNLPIIAKMAAISKACGNLFNLVQGTSAETSGRNTGISNVFLVSLNGCRNNIRCVYISCAVDLKVPPYGLSLRWAAGVSAQRAGGQVLLRDEEPEFWGSGASGRSMDNWNRGERRPPRSHH